MRFYKGGGNIGTHVGSLWGPNGQRLAQVGFYGWSGNFFTRIRNGIGRMYNLNAPSQLPLW